MDFPKPWLAYDDSSNFLEHIVHIYKKAGVTDIATVINSDFCRHPWVEKIEAISKDCTVIPNDQPDRGRLYSIQLGLKHLQSDNIYIHNVDSPFVSEKLIVDLAVAHTASAVTIPIKEGRKGHPILIGSDVKKMISERYAAFNSLRDLIAQFEQKLVDTNDDGIFANINTPEQYKQSAGERIR
jgi:CTP:molybdopterin cytidylyltransferase MocA